MTYFNPEYYDPKYLDDHDQTELRFWTSMLEAAIYQTEEDYHIDAIYDGADATDPLLSIREDMAKSVLARLRDNFDLQAGDFVVSCIDGYDEEEYNKRKAAADAKEDNEGVS
ncbi:MAG: hypothetical protein K5637_01915 [Lachnospiraceae bacterium]|nr:hypothetical protein [Lachnospiraceae bacterium]